MEALCRLSSPFSFTNIRVKERLRWHQCHTVSVVVSQRQLLEVGEAIDYQGESPIRVQRNSSNGNARPILDSPVEPRSVHDYLNCAAKLVKEADGGPPRWFCPIECDHPPQDAPLLLFLPGLDGTGIGLIRHYKSLSRMFKVWCLHIPVYDRTHAEGLITFVEGTLNTARCNGSSGPIYFVGDSFGSCLALAVAARNPSMDLVLVLINPATSFSKSRIQPLLPLLDFVPKQIYAATPFLFSNIFGDPIRMLSESPALEKVQELSESLITLLSTLPVIAEILPKETLTWKINLLKLMELYTNSRLHAIKAEVLILASGNDHVLPSVDEARRLQKALDNCVVRYFKNSGHFLLLEQGIDLGTVIRGAKVYRKGQKFDAVSDFVYPDWNEFEEVYKRNRLVRQISSPVFFSKLENGSLVRGLSGVPKDVPILLVGYHMLMGIELTHLVTEFMKRNQLIRGIAHPLLFSRLLELGLPERGFYDDAAVFGAIPATKKNFFKVMSRKESVLLYPGGAREALHRKGEAYKLFWPERSEFVRMAARFGYTIVPFGVIGEDDLIEVVADYNELNQLPFYKSFFTEVNEGSFRMRRADPGEVGNQELHIPLLLPKVPPGRIYFLFGKPFPTIGKPNLIHDKQEADRAYYEVKKEVEDCLAYLLKKREQDPYRAFLPRFFYEILRGGEWQMPTFEP